MGGFAPVAMLFAAGAAWGLTLPLIRIAVSTGHQPLGIVLWQNVVMAAMLGVLVPAMRLRAPRPARGLGRFVAVALLGAIVPGYFSYLTAAALPAGVRAIVLAVVPMFALPIALAVGFERPDARRALGVALGAAAIVAIALQGAGPAAAIPVGAVLLALMAPLSYALEANFLAWRGAGGMHPFELLLGASLVGIALVWPLALATGQSVGLGGRWGAPEWAILGSGVLNALAYSGYVWVVGRAGAVFASQIAYLVTGFGLVWSMLLLGERYPASVWAALALMLAGVALVAPRAAGAAAAP